MLPAGGFNQKIIEANFVGFERVFMGRRNVMGSGYGSNISVPSWNEKQGSEYCQRIGVQSGKKQTVHLLH
jgi:hypothetical protein